MSRERFEDAQRAQQILWDTLLKRDAFLHQLVKEIMELRREGFSPVPPVVSPAPTIPAGMVLPDEVLGAIRERAGANAQLRRELNEAAWAMLEQKMEPKAVAAAVLRGEALDEVSEDILEDEESV